MKKILLPSLLALTFAACSKDQTAVRKLDGAWLATSQRTWINDVEQNEPLEGSIRYEFTKCRIKKEELCDAKIIANFDGLNFELDFGYRVEDDGETLVIDEDKNMTTTEDQNRATIISLDKETFVFGYSENIDGDTYRYEYTMTAEEE